MGQLRAVACQTIDGSGVQAGGLVRQPLAGPEELQAGIAGELLNFGEKKIPHPVGFMDSGGLMCLFVEQIQIEIDLDKVFVGVEGRGSGLIDDGH
jgi:hypothetical protein